MLLKCCTWYASKFGKLSSGQRTGKGQFSFKSQRKAMPKNVQTTTQLHAFHTLVTHSSILAWKIPGTEEPGGLLSMESHRVGHSWSDLAAAAAAAAAHASKLMLKILQTRLQSLWTVNFQMFKLVLEKAEEPEVKLLTSTGSSKKQEFQKNIYFCFLTLPKPLTGWITTNHGKFWKRWKYQTTWPASWETHMQVRKQQLELNMEQQTGSK